MKDEFYRPKHIEFNVTNDGTLVPGNLGNFEDAELAAKFMADRFTFINQKVTVSRHIDQKEKQMLRDEYIEIMENIIPVKEKELSVAENNLTQAKKEQKNALEAYNVTISEARNKANEAKRGIRDMDLDEKFTYRIAYKGRYYFFTYIDKEIKLCMIRDIPEYEKTEIWNQMAANEEYIEKAFGSNAEKG